MAVTVKNVSVTTHAAGSVEPRRKLLLQTNGMIVLETRGRGYVKTGCARDLRYHLEYKSIEGWRRISSVFEDELTARQVLRESNPRICWRLVASNEFGSVALPKNWKGYRS